MNNSQSNNGAQKISVEKAVRERYAKGALEKEAALCCAPSEYDEKYLELLPDEIIERDYGCGDPSKHVQKGETVLDLGSGTGKICYIMAQIVGSEGNVLGVDMNHEMLRLARKHQREITERIGYNNVQFHRGKIQDLRLDLDKSDRYLRENPIKSASDLIRYEEFVEEQRRNQPLIPDQTVDLVMSNCVLNLVKDEDKKQLFSEIFRVLKVGGRVAISDIVSDEEVPEHLKNDPELWSGCISGALIQIEKLDEQPWQTVEGIEFRALTVTAYKGKEGPCLERNQAVVYRGPWKAVIDDDGHTLYRGERMAVCDKTFQIYSKAPYGQDIIPMQPYEDIPLQAAESFACNKNARRHPRETKGIEYNVTEVTDAPYCGPEGCC
jgi:ubiquinone/menaquinone biosynthesis C-methylase UbiE